jgi:hypothetical protein
LNLFDGKILMHTIADIAVAASEIASIRNL